MLDFSLIDENEKFLMIFHVDIISGRGSKTKRLLYTIFKVQITIFNAYFRRDSLNERGSFGFSSIFDNVPRIFNERVIEFYI